MPEVLRPGTFATVKRVMRLMVLMAAVLATGCEDLNNFRFFHENRGAPATWNAEPASVPLEPDTGNGLVLPVTVNGETGFRFRFDSLVPVIVMSHGSERPIPGARPAGRVRLASSLGPEWTGQAAENVELTLGDLVLREHAILLADQSVEGVDGLLGHDLMRRAVVEVDAARENLRLHRPRSYRPPRSAAAVPMVIADRLPYVDVSVEAPDGQQVYLRLELALGENADLILSPDVLDTLGGGNAPVAVNLGGLRLGGLTAEAGGSYRGLADGRIGLGALDGRRFAVDIAGAFFWIYGSDPGATTPAE